MKHTKTMSILAGGTGGHIYPALAVAKRWQDAGHRVFWIGTRCGLEYDIVPKHDIKLYLINVKAMRGKGFFRKLQSILLMFSALAQSILILRKLKPNVVLGMGGYVSGPAALAARILGIPLILHEQNSTPGKTNRLLKPIATKVLQAFPSAFSGSGVITCGNPVRSEFIGCQPKFKEEVTATLKLLIVGGSRGALKLNTQLPEILAKLDFPLVICHQAGSANLEVAIKAYQKAGVTAEVLPYIDNIVERYLWADVVIARSGAMTVFELMAVGRPAIFIPFPFATDDHQTKNAQYLSSKGAGFIVQQSDLSVDKIAPILQTLHADISQYNDVAQSAYKLRVTDADMIISTLCEKESK